MTPKKLKQTDNEIKYLEVCGLCLNYFKVGQETVEDNGNYVHLQCYEEKNVKD